MTGAPHIQLVDDASLPEYPEELFDPHLSTDFFTAIWHDRWFQSEQHLKSTMDVQGAALNLYLAARKQIPVGSLPDDDVLLAKLIHVDLPVWLDLRSRAFGPLRHWTHYRAGGRVVLGHPVVIEITRDAVNRREGREVTRNDKATFMRLKRMRENLTKMGCSGSVVRDDVLIERMDAWLVETHRGQRRAIVYERALKHAAKMGWLNEGGAKALNQQR